MNLLNIIIFNLLFVPLYWELINDASGDQDKKIDVFVRTILMITVASVAMIFTNHNCFTAFNLSLAIHFLLFDYCIAAILIHNGTLEPPHGVKYHWFSYSGKSGVIDNLSFWKNLNPYVKLLIRVTYFLGSLVLYFTI